METIYTEAAHVTGEHSPSVDFDRDGLLAPQERVDLQHQLTAQTEAENIARANSIEISEQEIEGALNAIERIAADKHKVIPKWYTVNEWGKAIGKSLSATKRYVAAMVNSGDMLKRDKGEPGAWRRNKNTGAWYPVAVYKLAQTEGEQ